TSVGRSRRSPETSPAQYLAQSEQSRNVTGRPVPAAVIAGRPCVALVFSPPRGGEEPSARGQLRLNIDEAAVRVGEWAGASGPDELADPGRVAGEDLTNVVGEAGVVARGDVVRGEYPQQVALFHVNARREGGVLVRGDRLEGALLDKLELPVGGGPPVDAEPRRPVNGAALRAPRRDRPEPGRPLRDAVLRLPRGGLRLAAG